MKLMIISDIHGSSYYLEKVLNIYKEENYTNLIILGDVLYHGPRNDLPKEYNPKACIKMLKELKDVIYIKGNCDAEVDDMVLNVTMEEKKIIELDGKKIFLTHGHHINKDNLPKEDVDFLIYGHFHVPFIMKKDGIIIMSPGSISIPKENSRPSYIKYENEEFEIREIE